MISSGAVSVFVYGALQSPQVLRILLGRVPTFQSPAVLTGYQRFPVVDQVFPGMIAKSGSTTTTYGVLLEALSPEEMEVLDYFEGDEYVRQAVTVECDKNVHQCETYVWNNPISDLEMDKEWRYQGFCDEHLEWYLSSTVRPFRQELDELRIGIKS